MTVEVKWKNYLIGIPETAILNLNLTFKQNLFMLAAPVLHPKRLSACATTLHEHLAQEAALGS